MDSGTVQDRDIILWKANRNLHTLYRMGLFPVTLSDPKLPQTTIFYTFCVAVVMGGDKDNDFKFGMQSNTPNVGTWT